MRLRWGSVLVLVGCGARSGLDVADATPRTADALAPDVPGPLGDVPTAPDDPCPRLVATFQGCTDVLPAPLLAECRREYAASGAAVRADVAALLACIARTECRLIRRFHGACQGNQGALATDMAADPGVASVRCLRTSTCDLLGTRCTCALSDGSATTCAPLVRGTACCPAAPCFFGSF